MTVLANTMAEAERDVKPGTVAPQLSEPRETKTKTQPLVGITSGSISDQKVLADCYKVLDDLAIPYEKRITSVGLLGALFLPSPRSLLSSLHESLLRVRPKADSEWFCRRIEQRL